MPGTTDNDLPAAILDSWDRNNQILVNLLRALPEGALNARVVSGSPSVGEMFTHINYVRLIFLSEDVPEFPVQLPSREWISEADPGTIANELERSAKAVREAMENCLRSGQQTKVHYDHPVLFLQHMIWHEGYHHGQIKLALKVAGKPLKNQDIGRVTWGVFMDKTRAAK